MERHIRGMETPRTSKTSKTPQAPHTPPPNTPSRAGLATFLALTFASSAVFWWLIVNAGGLRAHGGLFVLALMWCPGVSALVTRMVFQHNVRGEGWGLGAPRWLAVAYVLPIAYAIPAYGTVWLAKLGGVDLARFKTGAITFVVLGSLQSLLSATGEELGWRGFLVPALSRSMSFGKTAVISGVLWAAWHVPLIIFADYNGGTPSWYSVTCFAIMVVAIAIPAAWLRLRSGSVWPPAILHASHNLYVQGFFDRVTVDTGPTKWLTGEFGAALAVTIGVTGFLFWRARGAVER
ncbi:MAG: type II CAAX endopeptidase family protein [Gemmatimonadaceae bacterium]